LWTRGEFLGRWSFFFRVGSLFVGSRMYVDQNEGIVVGTNRELIGIVGRQVGVFFLHVGNGKERSEMVVEVG
jgi:hypothetical protein